MIAELSLAATQQGLQRLVLEGAEGIERWVRGDARADAATRLAVYARAYRLRLLEALGKDYPALAAYLGAEAFEGLGRAYLDAHPSDTPSLRWFGRRLPEFLRRAHPFAARAELSEIAQWEWMLGEVFDAPDASCVSVDALAALPAAVWPALRLAFVPARRRLELRCNAPALCRAVQTQRTLPALAWNRAPKPWLIWRDAQLEVRWRSLDPVETIALDAACGGACFAEVCATLAERVGEDAAPLTAASLIKRWATDGLIADLDDEMS